MFIYTDTDAADRETARIALWGHVPPAEKDEREAASVALWS